MNIYDIYNNIMGYDDNGDVYLHILASAEEIIKEKRANHLTVAHFCALIDEMSGFLSWDVPIDYWFPGYFKNVEEDRQSSEEKLCSPRSYDCIEICAEYVTRKLCCLIDTKAPKEEIEEWYALYKDWTADYYRPTTDYPMSDTEKKIFIWFLNQPTSPEAFAESLSSQDIHSLLEYAHDLPNHDLPLDEADSEYQNWSKYQIVSQYIRTTLCYWLDQKYDWNEIDKWYRLNIVYNHVA